MMNGRSLHFSIALLGFGVAAVVAGVLLVFGLGVALIVLGVLLLAAELLVPSR